MEYERRYRCDTLGAIREKLLTLGYSLSARKQQIDTYFLVNEDHVDEGKVYLRVRNDVRTGKHSLDYHIAHSALATDERETAIADPAIMIQILCSLGHKIVCVVEKEREEYVKDAVTVTLDHVKGLGSFVEIETLQEERADEIITETAATLHLVEEVASGGYPDLLLETKKSS